MLCFSVEEKCVDCLVLLPIASQCLCAANVTDTYDAYEHQEVAAKS